MAKSSDAQRCGHGQMEQLLFLSAIESMSTHGDPLDSCGRRVMVLKDRGWQNFELQVKSMRHGAASSWHFPDGGLQILENLGDWQSKDLLRRALLAFRMDRKSRLFVGV